MLLFPNLFLKKEFFSSRKKYFNELLCVHFIDLNFDWIANLLVWIEPERSSLQSFSVNSQITNTLYANLHNPASLTVDPYNG